MDSKRLVNTMIVASGKGGVGKTWLSINLAHALGNHNKRVLLFDGDLGFANVNTQLGLNPKWDLGKVLKKKCTFEEAILNYQPSQRTLNPIDIITGRMKGDAFMPISKAGLSSLRNSLTVVAPKYDHTILDLSAGLDQTIQEFSTFAQHCLVVVTNDTSSLTNALAFIKVTKQRNPDIHLYVVVNMAESDQQGKQTYAKLTNACSHFLDKMPSLMGVIHRDRCVPESILKKTPILNSHPNSQAARDIKKVAANLMAL